MLNGLSGQLIVLLLAFSSVPPRESHVIEISRQFRGLGAIDTATLRGSRLPECLIADRNVPPQLFLSDVSSSDIPTRATSRIKGKDQGATSRSVEIAPEQ